MSKDEKLGLPWEAVQVSSKCAGTGFAVAMGGRRSLIYHAEYGGSGGSPPLGAWFESDEEADEEGNLPLYGELSEAQAELIAAAPEWRDRALKAEEQRDDLADVLNEFRRCWRRLKSAGATDTVLDQLTSTAREVLKEVGRDV